MTKFFIFSDLKKTKKTVLVADGFAKRIKIICLLPGPFFISQKKGVRKMKAIIRKWKGMRTGHVGIVLFNHIAIIYRGQWDKVSFFKRFSFQIV